ncbi:MAG: PPOX class F420-dependent oxidoreductase [Acidimicrobiia bacterium]
MNSAVAAPTTVLSTWKTDGTPVATPVWAVAVGGHCYFTTPSNTWKVRRLARNPRVTVAPGTKRGEPTGPALDATAVRVEDRHECRGVERALIARHPVAHRMISLVTRLRRAETLVYRLEASVAGAGS